MKIDEVKTCIGKLQNSRLEIEQVGEDAFNVISKATGAVMKRLVPYTELVEYVRCMEYVANKHGEEIGQSYKYIRPVHGV